MAAGSAASQVPRVGVVVVSYRSPERTCAFVGGQLPRLPFPWVACVVEVASRPESRAALEAGLPKGTVLFEAKAVSGTAQKYIANSALFNKTKVDDGIVLVALLRTAAEIEPSKLAIPFSANDKANMKGWFEFNE